MENIAPQFNFGVYLDYWEKSYQNSVVPEYATLKEELLNNKYYGYIEKTQHDEKLKKEIDEKWKQFEKVYKEWDVKETIEWIKAIENRYFDNDEEFGNLINMIEKLEINGGELLELNNKLFLKNMLGLNKEKDQYILMKHINRISAFNGGKYQMICGLCTINIINTVMIPCGHCYHCYQCSIKHEMRKCPICRENVTKVVQTYMSGFSK